MCSIHNDTGRSCIVLLALLASLPPGSAHAQPQRRGLPAPKVSVLPAEPVDIPMLRFNRLPAVDARINGRGPYRLIVDTGAAGVVLRSDLAKELGLKSPPGMTGSAVQVKLKSPGNKNIPATLVHIDNLTLGGAEFQGVWTVATELPFGDDLHGVIGMNVFHECLLTYDYPGNRIRLAQGSLPAANGRDIIPFTTPGNSGSHPVIEVEVGGESARFLIDTGMRGWFALPLDRAKRIGMEAGPVAGPKALFVGGSSRRQVARLGANIEFGQYVVEHPTVFLTDENTGASLGTGMVLGTSVLEHFVVTFDIRNSVVRLTRSSSTPITVPAIRVLGISLRKRNQYMEVWDVHPASQAKSLAIAEGGIVHEINGQPAETLYGTIEWDDLLESADTVTLKYSPNATTPPRTLEVQVLELLPGVG